MNWLLLFVPAAIALHFLAPHHDIAIFIVSSLAIVPLAGWMGRATEHLAEKTGEGVGGLLNATFGNAAELIIAIMALRAGEHDIVKASLTGSIIGNVLLVNGAAFLAGGLKFKTQSFNAAAARSQATMLTLAAIGLIAPMGYHYLARAEHVEALRGREHDLSLEISIVLLIIYGLSLIFSLHTHKNLFTGPAREAAAIDDQEPRAPWSLRRSLLTLLIATALIAWISEFLVASVSGAAEHLGMSKIFIGVIVVAIIGNAAEHSTAILMALKNRMDLSLSIANGSSLQIALFIAPVVVLASYFIGAHPMNLVFTPAEVLAIFLSVQIAEQLASDGESNWLEGAQLLSVYAIVAIVFYFLP
ncbi:MAG TPA: calcium/proton exchanger [Planctomycetota bacterium]|nr:calcium/proton exchanger [Planctomycetota bacterium]